MKQCPMCGEENNDNWPITVNGKIELGGCQSCWEKECDTNHWNTMAALEESQEERSCRVCGCTEENCKRCIEETELPCHWIEEDLCSACRKKVNKFSPKPKE